MKSLRDFAIILLIITLFCHALARMGKASEYQYVETSELANNSKEYNSQEVQIKDQVKNVSEYTGVYGGEYLGLEISEGVTVFVYKSEVHQTVRAGDTILVDGVFHYFALFGGTGHDMFISTRHFQVLL